MNINIGGFTDENIRFVGKKLEGVVEMDIA